jgi:hypothetical protein
MNSTTTLDSNEQKLVTCIVTVLELLKAKPDVIKRFKSAQAIDQKFMDDYTETISSLDGWSLELTAVHSWRDTLDDSDVLTDLSAWILYAKNHPGYLKNRQKKTPDFPR